MTQQELAPEVDPLTFWKVNEGRPDGSLVSGVQGMYVWKRGVNTATCGLGHRPPARGCGCGFWGTTSQEGAAEYWRSQTCDGDVPLIYVECQGAGRIAYDETGCRVEFAHIEAILDVRQGIDLSRWGEYYAVPIVQSPLDLAVTVEGVLHAVNLPVDSPGHVGVRIGDRLLNLPKYDRLMLRFYEQLKIGDHVRVARRIETPAREIAAFRKLEARHVVG
jgi:hypothetical protein